MLPFDISIILILPSQFWQMMKRILSYTPKLPCGLQLRLLSDAMCLFILLGWTISFLFRLFSLWFWLRFSSSLDETVLSFCLNVEMHAFWYDELFTYVCKYEMFRWVLYALSDQNAHLLFTQFSSFLSHLFISCSHSYCLFYMIIIFLVFLYFFS